MSFHLDSTYLPQFFKVHVCTLTLATLSTYLQFCHFPFQKYPHHSLSQTHDYTPPLALTLGSPASISGLGAVAAGAWACSHSQWIPHRAMASRAWSSSLWQIVIGARCQAQPWLLELWTSALVTKFGIFYIEKWGEGDSDGVEGSRRWWRLGRQCMLLGRWGFVGDAQSLRQSSRVWRFKRKGKIWSFQSRALSSNNCKMIFWKTEVWKSCLCERWGMFWIFFFLMRTLRKY